MRVLTAIGLCDEVGVQSYTANEWTHYKIRRGTVGAGNHQYDQHDSSLRGRLRTIARRS